MSNTKRHKNLGKAKKGLIKWTDCAPTQKKHGNPYKMCQCPRCREGLRTNYGNKVAKSIARSFRRQSKAALRKGEAGPTSISFGYMD